MSNYFLVFLLLIVFLVKIYLSFSRFSRIIESEYELKSINGKIGIWNLVYATAFTVLFLKTITDFPYIYILITLFWLDAIIDILKLIYYKIKKPATVFIKDEKFIQNARNVITKRITELNEIFYDKYFKTITLRFNGKDLELNLREYELEDLKIFLEKLIIKSGNKIECPPDLLTKLGVKVE